MDDRNGEPRKRRRGFTDGPMDRGYDERYSDGPIDDLIRRERERGYDGERGDRDRDRERDWGGDMNGRDYDNGSRDQDRDRDASRFQDRGRDLERDERRKKRKSRWGDPDKDKVVIPGLPPILPSNLTEEQTTSYVLQIQIEEFTRRLRSGDLGIPINPDDRSPSPEPIYNNEGKRLNTRDYRTRKKLEDERHKLILRMNDVNPTYKPPADYKPPQTKISEKVIIPQEEYPDINFVGLLIGPRGNTLKSMEKDSQSKIIIRGKGSVKEGKIGRKDGQPMPGEDEPLHAFVTAATMDNVKKAVARILDIIRQGIEIPENQNDLRRNQLRELALLNGTLRENDGPRCHNCGSNDHRSWQCPDKPNITNNVVCSNCGGAGHIARDCRERRHHGSEGGNGAKIDEEYMSLMAELGEAPRPTQTTKSSTSTTQSYTVLAPRNLDPPRALLPAPPPPPPPPPQNMANPPPPPPPPSQGLDMGAASGQDMAAQAAAIQANPYWAAAAMAYGGVGAYGGTEMAGYPASVYGHQAAAASWYGGMWNQQPMDGGNVLPSDGSSGGAAPPPPPPAQWSGYGNGSAPPPPPPP